MGFVLRNLLIVKHCLILKRRMTYPFVGAIRGTEEQDLSPVVGEILCEGARCASSLLGNVKIWLHLGSKAEIQ
jgi:hypothetical protein